MVMEKSDQGQTGVTKLFLVGAPASGKTTVSEQLRTVYDMNVVDMDDEILRLNGGVWPDIKSKEEVLQPQVLEAVIAVPEVILMNSYMQPERAARLRQAGFRIVLLEVAAAELRRRDQRRLAEEGWTNSEWFEWHQQNLQALQDNGLIDHLISGEQPPEVIAAQVVSYGSGDRGVSVAEQSPDRINKETV